VSEVLSAAFGRPLALDNHPKHDVAVGAAIRETPAPRQVATAAPAPASTAASTAPAPPAPATTPPAAADALQDAASAGTWYDTGSHTDPDGETPPSDDG